MKKHNTSVSLGTYPKWLGRIVLWLLRKYKTQDVKYVLYGRGRGSSKPSTYGAYPIRYCTKIAIYAYFRDAHKEHNRGVQEENFRLRQQVKELSVIIALKGGA